MKDNDAREQDERLKMRMAGIKNKILVMSGKGGVGKTTVAVNIAYGLAREGLNVGILDVDIHGPNVVTMLGIEDQRLMGSGKEWEPVSMFPNFKIVSLALFGHEPDQPFIWRGPMKIGVIKQFLADVNWGELDYLVIDAPPGTGDEPLSVCQLIEELNTAVIVTTPQDVAILDSRKSVLFAKQLKIPFIGIVENMSGFVCPHCEKEINLFGMGGGEKAAQELKVSFLGRIPIESEIVTSGDSARPFIHFQRDTKTANILNNIIEKLTQSVVI